MSDHPLPSPTPRHHHDQSLAGRSRFSVSRSSCSGPFMLVNLITNKGVVAKDDDHSSGRRGRPRTPTPTPGPALQYCLQSRGGPLQHRPRLRRARRHRDQSAVQRTPDLGAGSSTASSPWRPRTRTRRALISFFNEQLRSARVEPLLHGREQRRSPVALSKGRQ